MYVSSVLQLSEPFKYLAFVARASLCGKRVDRHSLAIFIGEAYKNTQRGKAQPFVAYCLHEAIEEIGGASHLVVCKRACTFVITWMVMLHLCSPWLLRLSRWPMSCDSVMSLTGRFGQRAIPRGSLLADSAPACQHRQSDERVPKRAVSHARFSMRERMAVPLWGTRDGPRSCCRSGLIALIVHSVTNNHYGEPRYPPKHGHDKRRGEDGGQGGS